MAIFLEVPEKLPGLNEYTMACRANRYAAAQLKRETEDAIIYHIHGARPITRPVTITFTWVERDHRRDLDNIAFGKKFLLDAMVKAGILPDDGQAWVRGFRDELTHGKGYGVRLRIEETE